ncbi:hypothetical protein PR048_023927 [Dryococelus australis]|uniref:KRR1 small subunit processome component second KH domain-containing protein n=1 Tax=Dryococelus australis TaxID=614101 RepID=A0ABQ9GVF6_9NEOP|nr:hypothetical protein PR048_023927 [Dryococelus australis]
MLCKPILGDCSNVAGCYVLVQGQTVAALGPYKGLQQVRHIAVDTMNNIHPVYNIKALMIKRELARDPKLRNENWERFLPKFKGKNVSKRKQPKKKTKKPYTPFPPPQPLSKVDKLLESGEYFLKEEQRQAERRKKKLEKQEAAAKLRDERRKQPFIPPQESSGRKPVATGQDIDIEVIKKKVKSAQKKKRKFSD